MPSDTSSWGLADSTDFEIESGSYTLSSRSGGSAPTSDLSPLEQARHDLDDSERNRRRELRDFKEVVKQLNRQLWFTKLVVVVLGFFVPCLVLGLSWNGVLVE